MKKLVYFVSILLGLGMLGLSQAKAAESLLMNGAGATFPYPLYSKWFYEYHKVNPAVQFNYQSIGSGGGIKQITGKTVDFGASDAPMTDAELAKAGAPILHLPTVLGAVVLVYNVPELGQGLRLSGPVIAEIFLGTVTAWNDPKIQSLNPGKTLPKLPILVAHRSDGSGTTYVFTDYLSTASGEWKDKVGTGKAVSWPTGLGGKGNEGVTQIVKQTPGSIGYVELSYAIENKLLYAAVQNAAGNFIAPSLQSVSEAAAGAKIPEDYRVSIVNAPGTGSYPIAAFTYLLVYKTQTNRERGKALVNFLKWAIRDGQALAEPLHYAPLPGVLVKRVEDTVEKIGVAQ